MGKHRKSKDVKKRKSSKHHRKHRHHRKNGKHIEEPKIALPSDTMLGRVIKPPLNYPDAGLLYLSNSYLVNI